MKCPYCHKTVRGDMPPHLKKNKKCHEKHYYLLTLQIQAALQEADRLRQAEDPRNRELNENVQPV